MPGRVLRQIADVRLLDVGHALAKPEVHRLDLARAQDLAELVVRQLQQPFADVVVRPAIARRCLARRIRCRSRLPAACAAMIVGDLQVPAEECLACRPPADGQEVDDLDEQLRPSAAGPPHGFDERVKPGMKRSSPIRSNGPLGMSRTPVASTTITPGCPFAKRSYQPSTSGVTKPSSVARHGTIAGTQVRSASWRRPARSGLNSRDAAASAASGQRADSN